MSLMMNTAACYINASLQPTTLINPVSNMLFSLAPERPYSPLSSRPSHLSVRAAQSPHFH